MRSSSSSLSTAASIGLSRGTVSGSRSGASRPAPPRPHWLGYSFTLHDPKGVRILGFDNAHGVRRKGAKHGKRQVAADHWHRGEGDGGRPYKFESADKLLADFFSEVRRILTERGISEEVVDVTDEGS